ncbi:MAG: MaoC family dehydratase N-terminal domain-containing protein [Pseudomonadales bacterium]|nr:MaoC family dehydratase N-terminal domain-containing protein [Halioglobus sp.]MCP5120934.1 MaoC family dehydratase N-terminal domain-containing protein [Pseudomonadales bacterium]MCP5194376.1 MaoC family dehydratase N-terminal domain-containing protein [Pseudomonadales bacterium]
MALSLQLTTQPEIAAEVPVDLARTRRPQYGRYLDELEPGQVFEHPRGFTFERGNMLAFARTFMQTNPLYLNLQYAVGHGFRDLLASPQMVFNVTLSLGVQNDSEKAIANLGYYQVQFLRPVYPGDTLRAFTRVLERKDRGPDKPGIARIRTVGVNQDDKVVLQYERKIMVGWRGDRLPTTPAPAVTVAFPGEDAPTLELPLTDGTFAAGLTGPNTYAEDFSPGDIIVHANGRTITEEHMALTYLVGNSHPLHFDRVFSSGLSGKMSGDPIVYGGLVFAWLDGLASRDVSEHAVWELGFTEGYHTQPAIAGDTVGALSRILAVEDVPGAAGYAAVTMQLIGVKNIAAAAALEQYGADLFIKEDSKRELGKDKIPAKIFEIERRLLIRRRPR